LVNFGWEYVWHCHLLGHEENDMMRPMIIAVPPEAPSGLVATGLTGPFGIRLDWNDNSLNATGFTVQRATDPDFTLNLTSFDIVKASGISQSYTDATAVVGTLYYYRVLADDVVGGIVGVPTEPSMTASSAPSNVVKYPTNLYYLKVISPHGTVVKSPDQPSYAFNTFVDLTATAFSGWTFTNWTGNFASSPNSANPVTLRVRSDLTVTANYSPTNPMISGNAGVGGALITYTGGTTVANPSGNYSFTVTPGWTGTVTPSKTGYIFTPANRAYITPVTTNQTAQNFTAAPITFSISGTTGVGGVTLSYTDGTPKLVNSDASGVYSITVPYGWTGTVTPTKTGYTFLPVSLPYTNVLANMVAQNYTATPILFTISGNAGVGNAILSYTDGTPKTVIADATGAYSITVLYNWSGTVTPSLPGYTFAPVNKVYSAVLANQTSQNYIATLTPDTISGNAGITGATLSYLDGVVKTVTADALGNYALTVTPGWTGTVTPSKPGYSFLPVSISYTSLTVSQTGQNYVALPMNFTITGNTVLPGVTLSYNSGTPQTTTSDAIGNYSLVIPYSSLPVTVTPTLTGYTFLPVNRVYSNVVGNQTLQNYTPTLITYTITGNAGVGGALLSYTDITPKTATADITGVYTFQVSYGWSGTVTPSLMGYYFTPVSRPYTNVLANQTAQDYTAKPFIYLYLPLLIKP
jgi:hypothetical protein